VVDAERGTRAKAFDHEKLAAALSKAAGTPYQADRLPFDRIEFSEGGKVVRFQVDNTTWTCDLASYDCSKTKAGSAPPSDQIPPEPGATPVEDELADLQSPGPEQSSQPQRRQPAPRQGERIPPSPRSPDGKWTAFVKENNAYVRSGDGGPETQLSQDGKEGLAYGFLQWAPDSRTLVAFRVDPGERKEVYLIESSPKEGGRAKLQTRPYALPGDKFTAYELNLFDVTDRKQLKPDVERVDFGTPRLHWKRDGRQFMYQKVDRGHQRFRVIEVDTHTGKARNLIDEQSKTFIWTAHTENINLNLVTYLDGSEEIIYASERDGWRHLYLIDTREGKIKNQITKGEYVVRGIDRIDEANRQVWFRASGRNEGQDPYLIHYYRVNFDGTGLVALTEGNGSHTIQYSPDRKHVIDTYSRVDLAPVHTLRRVADGQLVCELEKADITELQAGGWQPPEVFVAKGRDGKTDIWGIICRPPKFDPAKKYPVIEQIYAGPQGSFVPKTFSPVRRFASLTDLGFIVVQMDGMGTANRSKAFHDVCWKNLKDAGFPDRILWHQAVAKKYPYYDLSRVGIYGTSAGGQNSTAGVLFHPEFYKIAVSASGCHDNRMDKASWNEQWMGYPVGPQYAASSNIDNAHQLRGKLLLIVGEMDTNVPPESTLRLVDALIKAGKDFDLLVVPGAGHGMGGAYGTRRMQDFFVRHLLGVEPPDRNAVPRQAAGG
jgi:dipeptidyl aminopeptidase/acylaminoacyl peptidase